MKLRYLMACLLLTAGCTIPGLPPIVWPPVTVPPQPSPSPSAQPTPEPSPVPEESPSPIATPTPTPSATPAPGPSPCADQKPVSNPQAGPSLGTTVPNSACKACGPELAFLETVGYAPFDRDQRYLEMDNCRSGDLRACTYVSRVPVNGYPACTFFNSSLRPRKEGIPPANGICSEAKPLPSLPSPCPVPTPPQGGPSDVARINIFHFDNADQGCKTKGQPFVVPLDPPCRHREIHVTLTPKADPPCAVPNCDAQQHGRNVTWWAAGHVVPDTGDGVDVGCAVVGPMDSEPTFNRFIRATGKACPRGFSLKVQLIDPAGKVFTAEKTVEVQ